MIGQHVMFQPEGDLPLRKRVTVQRVELEQARCMLQQFHYLHRTRVGRQINYAVMIDGVIDGVVTYAYPMMSSPLLGVSSDELVEFARLYLHSNIPHTATCAIGKTIRRIKEDWATLFPDAKPLRLVVSWSDTTRHKGTIYKAANFQWVRRTKPQPTGHHVGSKRGPRRSYDDYLCEKDCWVYWLEDSPNQEGLPPGAANT
jgi:hypothetical protein